MQKIKRWWKRVIFRWGSRRVKRDKEGRGFFSAAREIIRTPKVHGRRLALKEPFIFPTQARKAEQAVRDYHQSITPRTYLLTYTRRYPSIRGMRTELYYDRPSLKDLIEKKKNRRVRNFLRQNGVSADQAQLRALAAYDELEDNCLKAQFLRVKVEVDVKPDQFLVNTIEKME